jgi:hypothetical protein
MSRFVILASVFALAVGTVGCGNSQGPSNSLVDVGPSAVSSNASDSGNLATLARGGRNAGGSGGGGTTSGGGGGTISLVLLNSTDGLAHFGQKVTFNVSTTSTQYPWVTLKCSQGGALVYQQSNGIFPTSLGQIFTLASGAWVGGAADCTATLENWDGYPKSIVALASMSFHVYP